MSAAPRSTRVARSSSSPGGPSGRLTSSSSRSRHSPASRAKKSAAAMGLVMARKVSAPCATHHVDHLLHRDAYAHEHGTAYDAVPDVELLDLGNDGDGCHIAIGQPVPRVHGEPHVRGMP